LRHGSFEFPFPGSLTSTFLGRWAQVAELLDAAQTEHTFKAVWSTNLPWGPSPCNGVEPYPF